MQYHRGVDWTDSGPEFKDYKYPTGSQLTARWSNYTDEFTTVNGAYYGVTLNKKQRVKRKLKNKAARKARHN